MIVKPSQTIYHRYKSPFGNTDIYPQAKVYDSDSGDVVSTKNLSANANDSSLYEVTDAAPSAEGLYHVVVTPYSDAGHTVVYESEGATIENIEVRADRHVAAASFGGGEGILEGDIKAIIDGVVKKLKEPILEAIAKVKLEEKDVDMSPILKAINNIDIPKPEKYDDSKIIRAIDRVEKKIKSIDISPLVNAAANVESAIKNLGLDAVESKLQNFVVVMENMQGMMPDQQVMDKMGQYSLDLLKELLKHKEVLFKMDEMQQKRMTKMMQAIQQAGFLNTVNVKEALNQLRLHEELEI